MIDIKIVRAYFFSDQNESALKYCLKAEKIIKKTKNDYHYLNLVEIIQYVYRNLGDFKKC